MKQRLGDILVGARALSAEMRDKAVAYRAKHKVRFGTALLELGLVAEEILLRALSVQSQTPPARSADLSGIRPDVIRLIPPKLAAKFCVIPFRRSGRSLAVAMRDPKDLPAVDEVAFLTGLSIVPHVALEARILAGLERYYNIPLDARYRALIDKLDRPEAPPASAPAPQPQAAPPPATAVPTGSYVPQAARPTAPSLPRYDSVSTASRTYAPQAAPPAQPWPQAPPQVQTGASAAVPPPAPQPAPPAPVAGPTPPAGYYDQRAVAAYGTPYRGAGAPVGYPAPAPPAPAPQPAPVPQIYRPQQPPPQAYWQPSAAPVPPQAPSRNAADPWGGSTRSLDPELHTESDLDIETTEVSGHSGAFRTAEPAAIPYPVTAEAPAPVVVPPAAPVAPVPQPIAAAFAPAPAMAPTPQVVPQARPVPAAPVPPVPAAPAVRPAAPEVSPPAAVTPAAAEPLPEAVAPDAEPRRVTAAPVELVPVEVPAPPAPEPQPPVVAQQAVEPAPELVAPEAVQLEAVAAPAMPVEEGPEEPIEPEPPPALGDLVQRLSGAESRDDIADAVLAAAVEKVQRAALFIVQADQVIGWSARPSPPEGFRSFSLPFKSPSVFATLRNSDGFYSGPCPDLPANRKILQAVGATFPSDILVLPVTLKGKSVLFIAGVTASGDAAPLIAELRRLATMTATALEILLLKNRLRNT